MFYHYILMLPATITIYWLVEFVVRGRSRLRSQFLFVFFLLSLLINNLATAVTVDVGYTSKTFYYLDFLDAFAVPAAIPIVFLYVKRATVNPRYKWKEALLFLPALVVGFGVLILGSMMGLPELMAHRLGLPHQCTLTGYPFPIAEWQHFFDTTLYNWVLGVSLIVLGYLMSRYLRMYRLRLEDFYANVEDKSLKYLHQMLIWSLLFIVISVVLLVIRRAVMAEHPVLCSIYVIVFATAQCFICYNAYRVKFTSKDLFVAVAEAEHDEETNESMNEHVSAPRIVVEQQPDFSEVETALKTWVSRDDKPYLADGLTIAMVSKQCGLRQQLISAYINGELHMNFNSWVNGYRMEEVKQLLVDAENYTMLDIAARCGISDAAALTRLFKKFVGVTPSQYRAKYKID